MKKNPFDFPELETGTENHVKAERPLVLVLEDEPIGDTIVRNITGYTGDYEVALVKSVEEAYVFLKHRIPDVAILDCLIHGDMDGGVKVGAEYRSKDRNAMIIWNSAYMGKDINPQELEADNSTHAWFDDKTSSGKDLATLVRSALARKKVQTGLSEARYRAESAEAEVRIHADHLEEIVTERTAALNQANAHLNAIFSSSPDAIMILDEQGNVIWNNPRALEYLGQELVGKSILSLVDPADRETAVKAYQKALSGEAVPPYDVRIKEKTFEIRSSPFEEPGYNGKLELVVATDVTDIRTYQQELIRKRRTEVVGELVDRWSHELNNALQPIRAGVETLLTALGQREKETDGKKREICMKAIGRSSLSIQRGVSSTTGLVEKIDSLGRGHLKTSPVNIYPDVLERVFTGDEITLAEYLKRGTYLTGQYAVHLRRDYDTSIPLLQCDSGLLRQVLQNLQLNACEALEEKLERYESQQKPLDFEPEIKVTTKVEGDYINITVRDNGIGIPSEHGDRIFEPFFTSKKRAMGGKGLGLSIVKELIELHQGKITYTSESGQFTEFTISLPYKI
ncbi:PAS domain S-box protein [Candidatus Woesearchaeota archaeon]|nr:PAS domain S-box protein [Candidatus Woesearchaeota archaeon]